jgi:hypothetical protein
MLRRRKARVKSCIGDRGSGLVIIIAASLMVAMAVLAFCQYFASTSRSVKLMEVREDITDLQNWISQNVDCSQTVSAPGSLPPACSSGTFMEVKDSAGTDLISIPGSGMGTLVGRYYLRATCSPCAASDITCGATGFKLEVEAKQTLDAPMLLGKLASWSPVFDSEFQKQHPLPCPID